jgi:hypothetical protein
MKIINFLLFVFLLTALFAACSGTPTSKYELEAEWDQYYLGSDGGVLDLKVTVDNFLPIPTRGKADLKITCYDGAIYKEDIEFKYVLGLSSTTEKKSKHVDGKRVTKVEIIDDEFYYR